MHAPITLQVILIWAIVLVPFLFWVGFLARDKWGPSPELRIEIWTVEAVAA